MLFAGAQVGHLVLPDEDLAVLSYNQPRRWFLMAANFVSHTSGTQTVDGSKGRNNKLDRGGSVVANRVTETGSQKATIRSGSPKYANQTGEYGEITTKDTPENQHGLSGKVEPASKQP